MWESLKTVGPSNSVLGITAKPKAFEASKEDKWKPQYCERNHIAQETSENVKMTCAIEKAFGTNLFDKDLI